MPASQAVSSRATIIAFDVLATASTLFGIVVFSTVYFSRGIYRRPTWYAALVCCCFYTGAFLLLLGWQHQTTPPSHLCAFQAFLIYALPPHCTAAVACYVIDFYLTLKDIIFKCCVKPASRTRIGILLAVPFIVFLVGIVTDGLVLMHDPKASEWQFQLYCHLRPSLPTIVCAAMTLFSFLVLFTILVRIGLILWRHHSLVKKLPSTLHYEVVSLYIRVAVFSFGIFAGMIIGIINIVEMTTWHIASAFSYLIAPTVVFVALGTQRDITQRWMFWKHIPSGSGEASLVLNGKGELQSLH